MVLHMHSVFLTHFLKDKLYKSQHAYIPGKGTTTAWKDLLNKVDNYKYIYEIDLKQCFPNIQGEWITYELGKMGVPEEYVNYLEGLNHSTAKNTDEYVERRKKDASEKLERDGIRGVRPYLPETYP